MHTCKACGKKFKTRQSLGGHMSSAHGQGQAEGEAVATPAEEEMVDKPEKPRQPSGDDSGVMEDIRTLLGQEYTPQQIKEQFGYARRTVDQVAAEYIRPEGKAETDKDAVLPAIYKIGEVLNLEALLRRYTDGTHEDEIELRGMMKFRAAMLMVMDLVNIQKGAAEADAKRLEPILKLMKETREEQDAAAARARESSVEIAERAAYDTASQLSQVIVQNNARITDSISQIRQAMGGKEESPLGRILNSMQDMQRMMQMFGVTMPGQVPGAQGGAAQPWQPPPIVRRSKQTEGEEDV
jgi:hypothetical protein